MCACPGAPCGPCRISSARSRKAPTWSVCRALPSASCVQDVCSVPWVSFTGLLVDRVVQLPEYSVLRMLVRSEPVLQELPLLSSSVERGRAWASRLAFLQWSVRLPRVQRLPLFSCAREASSPAFPSEAQSYGVRLLASWAARCCALSCTGLRSCPGARGLAA